MLISKQLGSSATNEYFPKIGLVVYVKLVNPYLYLFTLWHFNISIYVYAFTIKHAFGA